MSKSQHIISDMTVAQPSAALSDTPVPNKWLILPYEGPELSGKMIWAPSRSQPEDVTIPLPAVGRCRIYLGIYSSGTVPYWFNLFVPKGHWDPSRWHRLQVRLTDDDHDQVVNPVTYFDQPRFTHICERFWKTADLHGQSMILRGKRKEVFMDAMSFLAFIRIEPISEDEAWQDETARKAARPWRYYDGTHFAHHAENVDDVKDFLHPARDQGVKLVFWHTSREDTCYYNSRVGNVVPDTGVPGNYPFYCGRDIQRMIAGGHDPLTVACDVAHAAGMKLFGSYRRMTYRMPPFVYPLHRNALMARRRDLWCADRKGKPLPHLSLVYPEVRQRMIEIQSEQVREYDVDGLHLFFCRGVPFVGFEKPFLDAFADKHPGVDPRKLPIDDERAWDIRAQFVTQYLRELRRVVDAASTERNRPLQIALHAMHCVRICRYFGLDVPTILREKLVDIFIPAPSSYLPPAMADWPEVRGNIVDTNEVKTSSLIVTAKPEHVEEFHRIAAGTGVELFTDEVTRRPYDPGKISGHRMVRVTSMDGMILDSIEGLPTCG